MQMKTEISGAGQPLVLVPGGLTGWISWKPHAERLASSYRVIRVQLLAVDLGLRGEPLPKDYSVETEIEALGEAIDRLGVAEAHFAAWSYGALTALSYAARNPARIRSLTLIEPPAAWVLRSRGAFTSDMAEDQKRLQSLGPGDVSESQLAWFCHFAGFVPPQVDPRSLPQWPAWVQHRQSLRNGDAAYRHQEDIAKVRAFSKPVLLFKGEGSSDWLRRIIDALAQEFRNAPVHELPGGHALHLVSLDPFMDTFQEFLQRRG
jgi:pimeloyl-ACP methyl ester carboxylesterase